MNINRDNYEEYFLLYADNELSEQEKNIVEAFVNAHPDLEEELSVIKLSVTKPDDNCVLEDKSFLFKETNKFINDSNYQEVFILYNDNELTDYERKETEAFLLKNPALEHEFELFQKTKFQPDSTIEFPNKKLLYKREDDGKVIALKWWKAAAAAILLGIGIWSGGAYLQKINKNSQGTVKIDPVKKVNKIIPSPVEIKAVPPMNVVTANKETKLRKQKLIIKRNISKPPVKKEDLLTDLPVVKNQTPLNNLSKPDIISKDTDKEPLTTQIQSEIDPVKKNNDEDNSDDKKIKDDVATANNDATSGAHKASFKYDSEDENNNNYAFYNIPQEKFNRSKVGGFLRKVKRVIERKISPLNNTKDKTEMAVN